MYQEELLEHYKYPKYKKEITKPDFSAGHATPSCGDRISIEGKIENDIVVDVGFSGSGCVVSQATASMLLDKCVGQQIDDLMKLTKNDIITLVGMPLGPNRLKCALLSLEVLQAGLQDFIEQKTKIT